MWYVAYVRRGRACESIFVRDSGFGVPKVYNACEGLDTDYTIGIGMNSRLKKLTDSLLEEAVSRFEATGEPQRLFSAF